MPFLAIFAIVLLFVLVSYQPATVLFAGFVVYALSGYVCGTVLAGAMQAPPRWSVAPAFSARALTATATGSPARLTLRSAANCRLYVRSMSSLPANAPSLRTPLPRSRIRRRLLLLLRPART